MAGDGFPMFPLGSVLLPGMLMPLHVFEERYRRLVDDVLASDPAEFGVCLIDRGSEVGGGDIRTAVGCVARVLEGQQTDDGRWALLSVGVRRIRIVEWLDDDPYPRAVVEDWADPPVPVAVAAVVDHALDDIERDARRVAALASELGATGLPSDLEFADDPALRSYQLAVMSPLGSLDRQRVLVAPDVTSRVELLAELIVEQEQLIRARLEFGGGGLDIEDL